MKILRIILLFSFAQTLLFASGGSPYTRLGLGEFHYTFSARRFGLGGLGFAVPDKDYISYTNPAGWSQLESTRFETGYLMDAGQQTDKSFSVFNSNSYFNGMIFGFPIERDYGITFVSGIVPYSNVNYELSSSYDSLEVDAHTLTYKGTGGISRLFFGTSYNLPFEFSLGLTFDYYNGRITNSTNAKFASSSTFNGFDFQRQVNYHGVGWTIGLLSGNLSKYLGGDLIRDFRLGVTFTPEVSLSADSANVFTTTIGSYENSSGDVKAKLPYRLGLGASARFGDNYLVTMDYMHQPMSEYMWANQKIFGMQDINKYSVGMEYRPSLNAEGFFEQFMLRTAVSYENTPYKINGNSINQLSVYAGFSIPLAYGNTIDVGFQYGMRGTTDNELVKEKIYRLNFTVSIGELWFITSER